MKVFLLALVSVVCFGQALPFPGPGAKSAGFANGYSYRRSITIQSSQITGTLTNYVFTMSGTLSYLAVVGSGGLVQNSNCYDCIFTSDSAGSTLLNWDIILYTPTTGEFEFKVQIPSAADGTVIYMFYGNSSISTIQTTTTSTYSTNFKGVWPLASNGASPSFINKTDRTQYANDVTTGFNTQASGTGVFDGGFNTGTGSSFQTATNDSSLRITSNITVECWVKWSSGVPIVIARWGAGGNGQISWLIYGNGGTLNFDWVADGSGTQKIATTAANTYADGNFHYVVGQYDGAHALVYGDATLTTGQAVTTSNDGSVGVSIGAYNGGSGGVAENIDDCRVSNTLLSQAWISATYKNKTQASFYAIGAQSP